MFVPMTKCPYRALQTLEIGVDQDVKWKHLTLTWHWPDIHMTFTWHWHDIHLTVWGLTFDVRDDPELDNLCTHVWRSYLSCVWWWRWRVLADIRVCTINRIPAIRSDRGETNSGKSGEFVHNPSTGTKIWIFSFLCDGEFLWSFRLYP